MRCCGRVLAVVLGCVSMLSSVDGHARRLPAPGGRAVLAVPVEMHRQAIEAHIFLPLMTEIDNDETPLMRLIHPPLPSEPEYRSEILHNVSASSEGNVWRLFPRVPPAALVDSVRRCLDGTDVEPSWPGLIMRALAIGVDVRADDSIVELRFSSPVGAVPELLVGCQVRSPTGEETGPYRLVQYAGDGSPAVLEALQNGLSGPPPLTRLEIRGPGGLADLVAGSPAGTQGGTLLTSSPDMILLLQSPAARALDPLELGRGEGQLGRFRAEFRADLIASLFAAGRGAAAVGVLPPGLAPPRPLPRVAAARSPVLALAVLPDNAPRIPIRCASTDAATTAAVDRIAVLLRSRRYATDLSSGASGPFLTGMEVLRWRPASTDPALALLALAGRELALIDEIRTSAPELLDPERLLSQSVDERLEAAMALEARWIEDRLVVPLMTTDAWVSFDPALRGVRLRADGVPLLDSAHWGGSAP